MGIPKPKYEHHLGSVDEFLTGNSKELLKKYVEAAKKDSIVGFIGGPPCPDFSVAGNNKGRNGDNGKLTESFVQTIIEHEADFFLIENVKGLWRTNKHKIFYQEMKNLLIESGYSISDRLTNSIEFGAPQDRDRILLFGINNSLIKESNKFKIHDIFPWDNHIKHNKKEILNNSKWPKMDDFSESSVRDCPTYLTKQQKQLTVEYWFRRNDVVNHPNAQHHFQPRQALARFQTIKEGDDKGKSFKRLHRWRYSPTAAYGNNEVHLHPYKYRRISAAEALALQSLPKEFSLPPEMTLSNMFKTIGNGVPYLLSKGIALTISDFLNSEVLD